MLVGDAIKRRLEDDHHAAKVGIARPDRLSIVKVTILSLCNATGLIAPVVKFGQFVWAHGPDLRSA